MARLTAIIGTETDVATLARALFQGDGEDDEAALRRAERALRAANPPLKRKRNIKAGLEIVVPDVDGLTHTSRVSAEREGPEPLVRTAVSRLDELAKRIAAGTKRARHKRESVLALTEKDGLMEAVQKTLQDQETLAAEALSRTKEDLDIEAERGQAILNAAELAIAAVERIPLPARPERRTSLTTGEDN